MMAPRRLQSLMASATRSTGLTVGCRSRSSRRPSRKLLTPAYSHTLVLYRPVSPRPNVFTCGAVPIHENQLVLRSTQCAHATIGLVPYAKILQFGKDLFAGVQQLAIWRQSMKTYAIAPSRQRAAARPRVSA